MATRMQQRRGTAQQWTDADPILAAGEIGFETDTNQFKIGDGVNAWSDLSYFKNLEDLGGSLDDYVPVATKGQPNGVAELDNTGKIPSSQIPALVGLDSEISSAVSAAVADLVDGAPAALDTLNEIATLIGDGSSIAGTLISNISQIDESVNQLGPTVVNNTNAIGTLQGTVSAHTTSISNNASDIETLSGSVTDHIADTMGVHGIADTSLLATKSYADDVADTAQSNAETNAAATADSKISTHNDDTTNVHGIADTAALATKTYADGKVTTHNSATTNVHGISDTAALATKTYADNAVTTAVSGLTKSSVGLGNVDNTSDASKPVSTATQTALDAKAPLASPTFTGTVSGITKSMVGLGNVDNTSDANKPVSTAAQTALDLKANLAGPTFTGTVALPSTTSIGNVSATEIGYVDGVTSAIQTQIDSKLGLAGGTMTGALTLSGAPTSDLHAATKLYVDNVTAGINFHEAVHAASTTNLAVVYSNGTAGVGATLTANTNRAFATLDGESVVVGQRVLIKDQTDAKQNGIYTLTTVGSSSAPWVLTRATDADNNPVGELKNGDFCLVINGTVNAGYGYINNSTANPIVIGTDNITYTAFNAGKTVSAGSGLTESTPGTLDIATGGVTSAMIADATIVDGDISASAAIAQSKISGLTSDLAAKAPLASPTFTGTVTVSSSGVAFTDGTQTKAGVPSLTAIQQKTASYTLGALTDRDNLIEVSSTSATTVTIPLDSTLNFPVGTSLDILQTNTGQITIAGAAGVTVNATPGLKLRTQWSSATLTKRAANTWIVTGDLSA